MKTLEQYLRDTYATGIIDHDIRAVVTKEGVTFYIRPDSQDGDTLDFQVIRNSLVPITSGVLPRD